MNGASPPISAGAVATVTSMNVAESLFVTCAHCGRVVAAGKTGRPRRYCDDLLCKSQRSSQRMRDARTRKADPGDTGPVRTVHTSNAELVAAAARLYIPDGATVADVTYGKGAFWARTRNRNFRLVSSDLDPAFGGADIKADCRALPYRDSSIGVVVLDPPYIAYPGRHLTDHRFNNNATTPRLYHEGIIQLYADAMADATRVLLPGGFLWVKCKDEVSHDRQNWAHIEIHELALKLGYYARDLFVVVARNPATAMGTWRRQLHARKTHSFMWVFEKDGPRGPRKGRAAA